jgi:uncharacterized protein with PIN domain
MKLIDAEKYGKSLQESLDNAKRWKEKAIKAGAGDEIVIRAQASIDMLVECLLRLKEQPEVKKCPSCGAKMEGTYESEYQQMKRKASAFYSNADEDGMVDVSDYPYTK